MILPEQIDIALDLLENGGFETFLVGGCVRDHLMGREQKDYDITTEATPEQVIKVFDNYKVIETGIKHGTVTVIIDSLPLEITTYRQDGDYTDNRRPESVSFTKKMEEDVKRRDFTINSVCYNPKAGFVDLFGGIEDIKNKVIRAVGDSEQRFSEDALRILRAIRFSAQFGFEIEENTQEAIFKTKSLLEKISAQRIAKELNMTLAGENMQTVFLKYYEIFGIVIPEILPAANFNQRTKYHCYDVLEHCIIAAQKVKNKPYLKLAALFHDIGKPSVFSIDKNGAGHFYGHTGQSILLTDKILSRLKYDNLTKNKVLTLIKYHDIPIKDNEKAVKRWFNKLEPDLFFDLIELKKADCLAQSSEFRSRIHELESVVKTAQKIIEEKQCFSLKSLCINGNDLRDLGIREGREIGKILNIILDLIIEGKLNNNKEELLDYVSKIKDDS